MKVKYDESFEPLRNKHHGYTFIPSNYGNPAMSGQKNDRKRFEHQWLRMQCNQKAVTQWRNMSAATKNAWSVFASTYPQPSKKDPNVFLSGYQLFVKRNTYEFLHEGIDSDFILEPELSELPNPDFTAEINDNGMCLDVTEWYIKNFGILPEVGQFLICRIVPMAVASGQFFAPLVATLEVDEVFIDGLFLSLFFNGPSPGVVFSVYLSKPVHAGRAYPLTKFRYMGCFKPTQFIQLTDTPDDYTGQAGKFVAVKATEDGVEFVDAGGGGLTCEDLINCDLIQQIINQIDANSEIISEEFNTSVPPVKLGILYNRNAATNSQLSSSDSWLLPTRTQILAMQTYLGGAPVAGAALKVINAAFWDSIIGNTNSSKFNARGAGLRRGTSGQFAYLYQRTPWWTSTIYFGAGLYLFDVRSGHDTLYLYGTNSFVEGFAVRFCRDATGQADGVAGTYVGNNGRTYRTVVINELEWIADDLAETQMRDGSVFPERPDDTEWLNDDSQAYCFYDNDPANV